MTRGCSPSNPNAGGGGNPAGCASGNCKNHKIHMHIDADRDGTVDNDRSGLANWQWGAANKGAIILCNNDDDGSRGIEDNKDNTINGGNDHDEIAPLVFRVEGSTTAPGSMKAFIEVSATDATRIRIFDGRAAGKNEIIGPTAGNRYEFPNLSFTEVEYGMEATQYPHRTFNGLLEIIFIVEDGGTELYRERAKVRVAPWMMPTHLDAAEKVFVVDDGPSNSRFRADLARMATAAGVTLVSHAGNDVWMQDCMEIGYANLPNRGFPTVVRAPRNRPLRIFPKTLLAADFGYQEIGSLAGDTTFDSTGNLEVTPPCQSSAGKNYPFGRIYYGPGRPSELMDTEFKAFLNAQTVQAPIEIDTGWLSVGHVDEIISFVPAPGAKGFKLLLASPRLAYQILRSNLASHGASKLLNGRTFPDISGTTNVEVTISQFLTSGVPGLHLTAATLNAFNLAKQTTLDTIKAQFVREIGIDPANDVIEVPIIFMPDHFSGGLFADALTAGVVNMLVINNHCIIPKPFGPVVGGVDLFEKDLRDKLTPLGLTVSFLDDWLEYHVNLGEVHCGTNTLRRFTPARWWEFQP